LYRVLLGKFSSPFISDLRALARLAVNQELTSLKYFNDSQEIDFEVLSYQFNFQNGTFPLNLVLQSQQSARQGFTSATSGNWKVADVSFDPTDGFHEYRIDFIPGNVIYYVDDQVLASINTSAVPTSSGHLILSQWSNGDSGWSAGPPRERAVSTVAYVKGYFNSSDPARQSAASLRCKGPSALGAICPIPDRAIVPGSLYSEFFSENPNMTTNQTIYGKNDCSTVRSTLFMSCISTVLVVMSVIMFL
jgi:beta-glucanase (GH16 family)